MAFICCSSIAQATAYIRICLSTLRTILSIGQMAARHETNIPYSIQLIYWCTNFYQSNICIYTLHIQQIHTQCTYEAHNLVSVAWMEWQRKYTAFRFICFRPLFLSLSLYFRIIFDFVQFYAIVMLYAFIYLFCCYCCCGNRSVSIYRRRASDWWSQMNGFFLCISSVWTNDEWMNECEGDNDYESRLLEMKDVETWAVYLMWTE